MDRSNRGQGRRGPTSTRPPQRETPPKRIEPQPVPREWECEAEIIPGLEGIARDEIVERFGGRVTLETAARSDALRFRYRGDLRAVLALRTVITVYLAQTFLVPRPRGLLGNQQFAALLALIGAVRTLHPPTAFRTLRLSAAGEDSSVLTRLKSDLAARTGLTVVDDEGDLLLRLRRAAGTEGWEVLVRMAPRPLSARAWRVCNLPGALNAVVAAGMIALAGADPADRYLNFACGSGTLLIERLAAGPARRVLGCDNAATVLDCARANLEAANYGDVARLVRTDAGQLPFPDRSFDLLSADLPFGQLVGSHAENEALYPRLLAEATRVAAPAARLVLITHEVRLLERLLATPALAATWNTVDMRRIRLPFGAGGLNPRVYLLKRGLL